MTTLEEIRAAAKAQYELDLERLGTMTEEEIAYIATAPSLSPEPEDTEPW